MNTDHREDRRRFVESAILMHGTSPERERTARMLARLALESGAQGAAYGSVSLKSRRHFAPVHAIAVSPGVRWDLRLPDTHVRLIERDRGAHWMLMLRGVDEKSVALVEPILTFTSSQLRGAGLRDRPRMELPAGDRPYGRFLRSLDAYRVAGFALTRRTRAEPFRRELERDLPGGHLGTAAAIVHNLAEPKRLRAALCNFGHDLEQTGWLPEAAAVYSMLYELALLTHEAPCTVDAARWAGRAHRKAADWTNALRWYRLARRIAEQRGDLVRLVRVLDGLGNTHRERGAFPKARVCYRDAWKVAQVAGSPTETATVALGLMTVEREAGKLATAAAYGWTALGLQTDIDERSRLLLNVGTLLRDGGDLDAAESAYRVAETTARADEVRILARDARAYCAALRGDPVAYETLRPRAVVALPYVRVQLGYFRGASLQALGDPRADRVLAVVERYARAHQLAEWEIKSASLRARPLPCSRRVVETPAHVRRGLRELEEALV